jgi:hypothetical protein
MQLLEGGPPAAGDRSGPWRGKRAHFGVWAGKSVRHPAVAKKALRYAPNVLISKRLRRRNGVWDTGIWLSKCTEEGSRERCKALCGNGLCRYLLLDGVFEVERGFQVLLGAGLTSVGSCTSGDFPIRKLLLGQMLRKLVGGELQELPPVMGGQLDAEQGVG